MKTENAEKGKTNIEIVRNQVLRNLRDCLYKEGYLETNSRIMREYDSSINPRFCLTSGNFLRDCMELPLRKKISATCPKVFEIGPCFRIEKEDETHLSEFYMMELYSLNETLRDMIALMNSAITSCMPFVTNTKEVSVRDFILKDLGIDIFSEDTNTLVSMIAAKHPKVFMKDRPHYVTVNKYIETFIESALSEKDCLYFLLDYPMCTISIAKRQKNSNCIERFECFINGVEVSNSFEDCMDADDLEKRVSNAGIMGEEDEELVGLTRRNEICQTVGLGIGVDRLCLLVSKRQEE